MKPHPMSRPGNRSAAKPASERVDSQIVIRCHRREKSAWVRAAQREGGLAKWVRASLNATAQRSASSSPTGSSNSR